MSLDLQLEPGDRILAVNGEDVKEAPRDHVIQLVRSCETQVNLLVCQPAMTSCPGRKSTLLSAGKRAKLRTRPSRVRFAESVCVNGAPLFPVSSALASRWIFVAFFFSCLLQVMESFQSAVLDGVRWCDGVRPAKMFLQCKSVFCIHLSFLSHAAHSLSHSWSACCRMNVSGRFLISVHLFKCRNASSFCVGERKKNE